MDAIRAAAALPVGAHWSALACCIGFFLTPLLLEAIFDPSFDPSYFREPLVIEGFAIYFVTYWIAVFFHEYGHATTAFLVGAKPRRIRAYGPGAAIEMVLTSESGRTAAIIAAGPFANLMLSSIACILAGVYVLSGGNVAGQDTTSRFLIVFAFLNLGLAMINLLPVRPLDGGHLSALPRQATRGIRRSALIGGLILLIAFAYGSVAPYHEETGASTSVAVTLLVAGTLVWILCVAEIFGGPMRRSAP